jgi:uncharacterized sporulation protein YeaH/YhbH (DUF444 family)
MTNQQLERAIDETQRLLRKLTEAKTLRYHLMADKSEKSVKSAVLSLDDVADSMGFCLVTKEEALARADRERENA